MKKIIIVTLAVFLAGCVGNERRESKQDDPMLVIFETDIGNDIDDALALDMLYKYMDRGMVDLIAVMNNKDSRYSTEFIDIMNTWYGYPDIPIGKLKDGVSIDDYVNYAQNVCALEKEGKPMFKRSRDNYDDLVEAHMLYRKVLSQQPDSSVTIISVGFSTNLARLLETVGDEYSPLSGGELVSRKVRSLSVMGGSFGEKARAEFNIVNDIPAARKLFAGWPGEIILSPFEVGALVQFPASVIENDFDWGVDHPLVEAYLRYRPMPYDRATWDLTSVLHAVDPGNSHMDISEAGTIEVNGEGYTNFTASAGGKHFVLSTDRERSGDIKKYFIDLITARPKALDN